MERGDVEEKIKKRQKILVNIMNEKKNEGKEEKHTENKERNERNQ